MSFAAESTGHRNLVSGEAPARHGGHRGSGIQAIFRREGGEPGIWPENPVKSVCNVFVQASIQAGNKQYS